MAKFPIGTSADIGDAVPADYWQNLGEIANAYYFNVKNPDFGALGNNSNDDTAEIQACIDASAAGDTIIFPPGTYILSAPIIRKPNRAYIGLGGGINDNVILKVANGSSANFTEAGGVSGVFVPESWYNSATVASGPVVVKNIAVNGNRANNTTGQHSGFILGHGEYWSHYENLYARECRQDGFRFTPLGRNGSSNMAGGISDVTFRDILATENTLDGIRCVKSGGVFVTDVIADGKILSFWNDGSGFIIDEAANWQIDHLHMWMNGKHGLKCTDGSYASRFHHIYVEDFGRLGTSGEFLSGVEIKTFNGRSPTLHDCTVSVNVPNSGVNHRGIFVSANDSDAHAWVHDNEVRAEGTATSAMLGFGFDNGSGGSKLTLHEHANHAYGFTAGNDKGYFGSATYAFDPPRQLTATMAWNPGNAATGTAQSVTITVTGAAVGDLAVASLSTMPTGTWLLSAQVTAANTVTVTLRNDSGSTVDPAAGTLRATVFKY